MSAEWEIYIDDRGAEPEAVAVDLAARSKIVDARRPLLLLVTVELGGPRPDGLPSPEDLNAIYRTEDVITGAFAAQEFSAARPIPVYLGRRAGKGRCKFHVYVQDNPGAADRLASVLAKQGIPAARVVGVLDPGWDRYLARLYPPPAIQRRIADERVKENLRANGDDHTVPRVVDHWVVLPAAARRAFEAVAVQHGFSVEVSPQRGASSKVTLHLRRRDTIVDIDPVIDMLTAAAENHGGWYEGWGCAATAKP